MSEEAGSVLYDAETRALEPPRNHEAELRLWLRLLTCTTMIETEIRRRLRRQFEVTLPRFDLMAQLEKAPEGLTLSALSQRMMVSSGNITGLVDRLGRDGLIERRSSPGDRRFSVVRLSPKGRASFAIMASAHARWLSEMLGDVTPGDVDALMELLGRIKASVRASAATERHTAK